MGCIILWRLGSPLVSGVKNVPLAHTCVVDGEAIGAEPLRLRCATAAELESPGMCAPNARAPRILTAAIDLTTPVRNRRRARVAGYVCAKRTGAEALDCCNRPYRST